MRGNTRCNLILDEEGGDGETGGGDDGGAAVVMSSSRVVEMLELRLPKRLNSLRSARPMTAQRHTASPASIFLMP